MVDNLTVEQIGAFQVFSYEDQPMAVTWKYFFID